MRLRIKNPTPLQSGLIGASAALAVGMAYVGVTRARRKPKPTVPTEPVDDLPEVDDDVVPPANTEWALGTSKDPGYPWDRPMLHVENWPTPGMWVDLNDTGGSWKPSNGFDSLVRAALGSALAMAGNDAAIAEAEGQDANAMLGRRLRREMRNAIIHPGGINDLLYGQTNANYAGGVDPGKPCTGEGSQSAPCVDGIRDPNSPRIVYMMNGMGRGLNWLPVHADILNQIGNGVTLERGTSIDGKRLAAVAGNHQMVVYIPAVDLVALGPNEPEPAIRFLTWPGGATTLQPPPVIQALGVDLHGVYLEGT